MIDNFLNKNGISPLKAELPSDYADRLGVLYSESVTLEHKKTNGQFFTPLAIARLMASFCDLNEKWIRILDPGCGTAVLTCALIEYLIQYNKIIETIDLVAYETDKKLIGYSKDVLEYLTNYLNSRNIKFSYTLITNDFILDNAYVLSKFNNGKEQFNVIISNPPYFKLTKDDKRTIAANILVSGHANIYSIFMGISSKLLTKKGQLIYITPRSFASGSYFKAFREYFFNTLQLERIHLFVSRKETFDRDSVLQETIIIKASREDIEESRQVIVSSTNGLKDIKEPIIKYFQANDLIDLKSNEKILHVPTSDKDENILSLVSTWIHRLSDFNIQISTGPVVAFRANGNIQINNENDEVFLAPLFWLHNVKKMSIEWPINFKEKGQYIRVDKKAKSLLIPNKNYIFLRRFSTKDDNSRLIAAPYFCNYNNSIYIGVENKVNYIYRRKGNLNRSEIIGLCALLNSELFDTYFQMFNGNVNVSASELREMKFPSLEIIEEIGNRIINSNYYSMENVNSIINNYFELELILGQ